MLHLADTSQEVAGLPPFTEAGLLKVYYLPLVYGDAEERRFCCCELLPPPHNLTGHLKHERALYTGLI